MVRQPAANCKKKLPDNSIIFTAEATAISLVLNYYQHIGPVHHEVVVYSDSMSCLQAIEGEDTENPYICHIMHLLRLLSDKGTHVRFCSIPSHCDIEGNERVDQLAKETHDQDIDPLASIHYTDMKELVNSYIQKWGQTKWDVAVHGRDLYIVKPTLGPSPPNPISWYFDRWLFATIMVKHWPFAPGVYSVTGMSWWILHSWLIERSLRDNSWDLHSGIPARSGILLSDMM